MYLDHFQKKKKVFLHPNSKALDAAEVGSARVATPVSRAASFNQSPAFLFLRNQLIDH